jgi:hypothetical protein
VERQDADAKVTVTDTGRGLEPGFLPYIFEPFRQAFTRNATLNDRLGLGLTIARQIVEGDNGKIRVDSAGEEKRTTFTISLPVEDETAATNQRLDCLK